MARRVLPLRICCVHRSTSSGTKYLCIIGVWALYRLRSLTRFAGAAGRSSTCVPKFVGRCLPSASLPGSPLPFRRRPSEFPHFLFEPVLLILPGDRDFRTKLGATGEE